MFYKVELIDIQWSQYPEQKYVPFIFSFNNYHGEGPERWVGRAFTLHLADLSDLQHPL